MHSSFVLLNAFRIFISILIFGIVGITSSGALVAADKEAARILFIMVLVLFVLGLACTLLISWIYYKRFFWEITESDIHVYSGIIFKKQVHVPFQRVQSIDFHAPLLERILGIVRLKIDTAGGALNRGVIIPALKLADAEALRAEVFMRKKVATAQQEAQFQQKMEAARAAKTTSADSFVETVGTEIGGMRGIFADSYVEEEVTEYEYGLTAKELFFSAISGDHNITIVVIFLVLASQFSWIIGLFGLDPEMQNDIEWLLESQLIPAITGGFIILMVFSLILGVVSTAVSYGGFKARRRGGRIEVERGLVTRQYKGVAIKRVQSIEINQGFIRRLLGYVELKLLTIDALPTSQNQQDNQAMRQYTGLVIHPFVKKDRVEGILQNIIPEFNGRPQASELHGLPRVSKRRVIIRHAVFFGLIYGVCALGLTLLMMAFRYDIPEQLFSWTMILLWGLFVLSCIGRFISSILWFKNASYTYNKTMLMIHQGYFSLVTTIIPRQKIQWAQTYQNPFQKYAKVASITAVTAAGVGGTRTKLRDIEEGEATVYLDWVRPRNKGSASR